MLDVYFEKQDRKLSAALEQEEKSRKTLCSVLPVLRIGKVSVHTSAFGRFLGKKVVHLYS